MRIPMPSVSGHCAFQGANILRRRGTQIATGRCLFPNESEKSRFVHALCELTPDENIGDLERSFGVV